MGATSASIRHQEREILRNTYNQNMKEFVNKATQRGSLKIHIEAKHEEPHYSCDQCEYKVQ